MPINVKHCSLSLITVLLDLSRLTPDEFEVEVELNDSGDGSTEEEQFGDLEDQLIEVMEAVVPYGSAVLLIGDCPGYIRTMASTVLMSEDGSGATFVADHVRDNVFVVVASACFQFPTGYVFEYAANAEEEQLSETVP